MSGLDAAVGGIAVDSSNNIALTGSFRKSINLGLDTFYAQTVSSGVTTSGKKMFVAKYDSDGHHLWSKAMGDPANGAFGSKVIFDSAGSIIVSGDFAASIDFGLGALPGNGPSNDTVVAKYSSNGVPLWSKAFGSTSGEFNYGLAVDPSGNVYVGGSANGGILFGTYQAPYGGGTTDLYLAKLAAQDGQFIWTKQMGGVGQTAITALAMSPSGQLVVSGIVNYGTVNLDGVMIGGASDKKAMFIAGYTQAGVIVFTKNYISNDTGGAGPRIMAIDSAGNIELFGNADGGFDFGCGASYNPRGFLVKLSPNGDHCFWNQNMNSYIPALSATAMAIDAAGNTVIGGAFNQSFTLGTTTLSQSAVRSAFIGMFSP